MADVRGASGAPAGAAFGGVSSPTPSTPLYVDLATGDLYVLISNVVTLVGSVAGGSSFTISNQSLGKHFSQLPDVADANSEMATRAFAAKQSAYSDVLDANSIMAGRALAIRQALYSDVSDSNQNLAARTFGYRAPTPYAVLGDASTIIQQRSFMPRPLPAMWS